jgi:hypothetical protein
MKKRQLSCSFVEELLKGKFNPVLKLVQEDDTIDMEMRGDSIIVYYRGGKLFELFEDGNMSPLDSQYGTTDGELSIGSLTSYCQQAKHLIDTYQITVVNNLGEREISQRIVMENNYSPYSYDTDYFIIDMEFKHDYQFDLVALKWESTKSAHRTKKCKIAILETKQGISTIRTSNSNPGLNRHYADYIEFLKSDSLDEFKNDMIEIFKQKCILGLIKGINDNNKGLKVDEKTKFQLSKDIEFITVIANYKSASDNLNNELDEMPENNTCKFALSSFMGYGLYSKSILDYTNFKALIN